LDAGGYPPPPQSPDAFRPAAEALYGHHVTRAADSFWLIAERVYGDARFYKALFKHNCERFPQPDRLPPDERVETPSVEELRQWYPELCPARESPQPGPRPSSAPQTTVISGPTYVVQGNESLFEIAQRQLGRGSRWVALYRRNSGVLGQDFDVYAPLPAGARVVLPQAASPPLAERPSHPLR
jgi:nucleoid-associated protein YgaU